MILAKYIRSNQTFGDEVGLVLGNFYEVKAIRKESYIVYLIGFNNPFNRKCFEFYEAKKKKINFK